VSWLLLLVAFCLSLNPCEARKPTLDYRTQEFIALLAHNPQLMNLEYLENFIGRPDNERAQRALPEKQYYWSGPDGRVRYQLWQTEQAPGQVVESRMIMHWLDSTVGIDDVQSLYGKTARRFFDYGGHATVLYSYVPNTQLAFVCPRQSFRVDQVKINYRGPALLAPSAEDMKKASEAFNERIRQMGEQGRWNEVFPLLLTRLKTHPNDPQARYELARACAAQGRIHDAVLQYRSALALLPPAPEGASPAGEDKDVGELRQNCIEGLRRLHASSGSPEQEEKKDVRHGKRFKIVQKGQRIRTGGAEKLPKSTGPAASPQGAQGTASAPTPATSAPSQPSAPASPAVPPADL
jgi:tetratricopeptide (TPR) repeat protein